jgi:hypothetical protein
MRAWMIPLSFLLAQPALADPVQEILEHPVIRSVGELLDQQHGGACKLPTAASNFHWGCLGALEPAREPVIRESGCYFSLSIDCPDRVHVVTGLRSWKLLLMPDGSVQQQTEPVVEILVVSH